jgi:hypothetical protein
MAVHLFSGGQCFGFGNEAGIGKQAPVDQHFGIGSVRKYFRQVRLPAVTQIIAAQPPRPFFGNGQDTGAQTGSRTRKGERKKIAYFGVVEEYQAFHSVKNKADSTGRRTFWYLGVAAAVKTESPAQNRAF